MIIPDGKKTVSMIIDGMGMKPDRDNAGASLDELGAISEDMLRAFKSDSPERLQKALRAFADMIARDDEMQDEQER
jgi:hypothetical protein